MSHKATHLVVFCLPVMLFLAYPDVCLGTKSFFYRDYKVFGYPLAHYLRSSLLAGTFPHWAPENFCGLPYFAQWNTLVLYPGSLLYVIFPPAYALPYFCLLHLCLGGWGMFRLARRWTGGDPIAGAVAALAFGFNGLALHFLMWPNNIAAYAWMPFVIDASDRLITKRDGRIIPVALVLALQILSGAPEIIALTWLFIGLLACVHLFPFSKCGLVRGTRLAGSVVLALALTAIQLLPFLRLVKNSQRSSAFGESLAWSMPGTGWANLIVPLFNTYSARQQVRWQDEQYWTSSYYPGIIVFALAILAIISVRNRKVVALSAAVFISLVFSLGKFSFIYRAALHLLPSLGFIRFPVKYIVLGVFCFPLLAAFGLNGLENRESQSGLTHLQRMLLAVLASILLLVGVLVQVNKYCLIAEEKHWDTLVSGLTRGAILAMGCGLVFFLTRTRSWTTKKILHLLLLAIMGLDILTHMERQNPIVDIHPALMTNLTQYRNMNPVPTIGQYRAYTTAEANHQLKYAFTDSLESDALILRLGLKNNTNLVERIPKVGGFFSLYPRFSHDPLRFLEVPNLPKPDPFLDFLGVSQITSGDNVYDWTYRPSAQKIMTAGQAPVYRNDPEAFQGLIADSFRPDKQVFVPEEARSVIGELAPARAEISRYQFSANHIRCLLTSDAPTMLTVAQSYYPAWKVSIDGEPGKIWRANHGFQAVHVPEGTHTVIFRYRDWTFHLGALISGTAWICCIILLIISSRKSNPRTATER